MHYLYKITNRLNNKIYIGQSNKEIERWRQHKYFARQDYPVQFIHRAMKKYGVENFVYEIIDFAFNKWQADCLEINYIQQYDSRNKMHGYNIAPGGEHAWNAGLPSEQQPMYGKKQSKYFLRRMSEVHGGSTKPPHTDEWKQNQKEWITGRPVSKETREKIAEGNRGKIVSKESRSKMASSRLGKSKISIEQKTEIIALKALDWSIKRLAEKYSCSTSTIYDILNKNK